MQMTRRSSPAALLGGVLLLIGGCSADRILATPDPASLGAGPSAGACWGQASAVFARTGAMGEHSRSFDTPRLGLRNLARLLYEAGVLEDDSMQALGAFVAAQLGLEIDACS
jgi:hypothetical protein